VDYEQAKTLSADPDARQRRKVAQQPGVRPEILFYLADDADVGVRAAVAENRATPRHADLVLTRDGDESVRARLAANCLSDSTTFWKATSARPVDFTLKKRYFVGKLDEVWFHDAKSGKTLARFVPRR